MSTIETRIAARKLQQVRIAQKAAEVYAAFDKNQRAGVRFGMFPREPMEKAQAELFVEFTQADGTPANPSDLARELAVAIMDAANRGPDKMIA